MKTVFTVSGKNIVFHIETDYPFCHDADKGLFECCLTEAMEEFIMDQTVWVEEREIQEDIK